MPYIRHRPRMVRQSVFEDVRELLLELHWILPSPWKPGDPYDENDVLGMLSTPVFLTDYFPVHGVYQGEQVEVNTLALDQGVPEEPEYEEMGSDDRSQSYTFNLAFFAENDAVALSIFSDLSDRYKGVFRSVDVVVSEKFTRESVELFNYLAATPTPVVDMEVSSFQVAKSPEQPAPGRMLWFAQLVVVDYLEMGD